MKRIIAGKKHFLFGLCIMLFLLSMLSVVTKASDNIYPTEKKEWVELVDITITAPEIGKNPVFDKKMDVDTMRRQGYGFEVSEWMEKSGNQSRYLTVNDRFEAGKTYTALIYVEAHPLYSLYATSEEKFSLLEKSLVNGKKPGVEYSSDSGESMVLTVDYTLDTYLNGVDITITEPMEGLTPGNTKAIVNKGACTAELLTWMKKEGSNYDGLVGESEKFKTGQTYSAYVAVYPKDGFVIDVTENGRKTFLGASKVNGITPYVGGPFSGWSESGKEFIFQVDLTVKEKKPTVINGLEITITTPVNGQKPNFKATVKNGACTAFVADWKIKNGAPLEENDKFVSGKTYTAYVWVDAKDGYKFDVSSAGRSKLLKNAKINGLTPVMHIYADSGSSVVLTVNIMAEEAVNTILKEKQTKASYRIVKSERGEKTAVYLKPQNTKIKKVAIPSNVKLNGISYKVTGIAGSAFKDCKKLTSVTIGSNVTAIGDKAFYKCKALTKITIPAKVTKIGKAAFYNCTNLKSVTMGANVTVIDEKAFYKCTALKKIVIPTKVEKIGKQAFYGCKKLKTLVLQTSKLNANNVGTKAFSGIYSKAAVKAPASKLSAYKKLLKSRGVGKKVKFGK